jgi:hypothetical protein
MTLEISFLFESGQIFLQKAVDIFRQILVLLQRSGFKNIVEGDVQLSSGSRTRLCQSSAILHLALLLNS